MFYSLENRPKIKSLNPEYGVGKLAQCLAEQWKLMNPSQKHQYDCMARKDKERYEQERMAYKKGVMTGSGLTARQVAHSVSGRTIPPPASASQRQARNSGGSLGGGGSSSSGVDGAMNIIGEGSEPPTVMGGTPSDDEGSPTSGDELDQLCEFYQ